MDNNSKEFLNLLIENTLRPDGRDPFQMRDLTIMFLDRYGQLIYRQGKTEILVKINAEIISPKPQRPSQGSINFRVNCMACPGNFQENKKYANELSKLLQKVILGSNALDPQSLCILTGKFVWALNIDCIVVKDDGNIIDAILNSVVVGLMDMKKPIATVQNSGVKLQKKELSLSLAHTPFSFSFGLVKNSILLDPNLKEESISETRLTITMNIYKQICSIHKPGGKGINRNILSGATRVCENQIKKLTEKMREDIKIRKQIRQWF